MDTEPPVVNEDSDEAEERKVEPKVEEKMVDGVPSKMFAEKPPNITIKCKPLKFNMAKGQYYVKNPCLVEFWTHFSDDQN